MTPHRTWLLAHRAFAVRSRACMSMRPLATVAVAGMRCARTLSRRDGGAADAQRGRANANQHDASIHV